MNVHFIASAGRFVNKRILYGQRSIAIGVGGLSLHLWAVIGSLSTEREHGVFELLEGSTIRNTIIALGKDCAREFGVRFRASGFKIALMSLDAKITRSSTTKHHSSFCLFRL